MTPSADPPYLSVIIPVYNEERYLPTIIERVRAVSTRKEIVCVNDRSKDRSGAALTEIGLRKQSTCPSTYPSE